MFKFQFSQPLILLLVQLFLVNNENSKKMEAIVRDGSKIVRIRKSLPEMEAIVRDVLEMSQRCLRDVLELVIVQYFVKVKLKNVRYVSKLIKVKD